MALWLLPIAATGIAVVLAVLGDAGRDWLGFDRPAIQEGEIWRLLTGHLVHLGPSHLLLNLAGLFLIWYLVGTCLTLWQWLCVVLAVIAGIDAGFWYLEPQLRWYVGLSGVLHGILAAGVIGGLRKRRVDIWIIGFAVIAKLAYEQLVGPLPGSEESTGGAVIVDAHAYGALAGALAGLVLIRVERRRPI